MEDENYSSDLCSALDASKRAAIPDFQFLKIAEHCGRALLSSSKRPAAVAVRKLAAQMVIRALIKEFGITYTESQIFKKICNMKQRLRVRIRKKEPLNESEQLLKHLLEEEKLNQTSANQIATTSTCFIVEPFSSESASDSSENSEESVQDSDEVKKESDSNARHKKAVLEDQLHIWQKQSELLDIQRKVYSLQKGALLAEMERHKSNEYS